MENSKQSTDKSTTEEFQRKRQISRQRYEERRRDETKQLLMRFSDKETVTAARLLIKAVVEHSKTIGKPLCELLDKYAMTVKNIQKKELKGQSSSGEE